MDNGLAMMKHLKKMRYSYKNSENRSVKRWKTLVTGEVKTLISRIFLNIMYDVSELTEQNSESVSVRTISEPQYSAQSISIFYPCYFILEITFKYSGDVEPLLCNV